MDVKVTPKRQKFLDAVRAKYGNVTTISRKQIVELVELHEADKMKWPSWLTSDKDRRADRGVFKLPDATDTSDVAAPAVVAEPVAVEPVAVEPVAVEPVADVVATEPVEPATE